MSILDTPLTELLGVRFPIVQAPPLPFPEQRKVSAEKGPLFMGGTGAAHARELEPRSWWTSSSPRQKRPARSLAAHKLVPPAEQAPQTRSGERTLGQATVLYI